MSDENCLSNARIIEYESASGAPVVGIRRNRGQNFITTSMGVGVSPKKAEELGARVVESFPKPTLAEVVGDAPAFTASLRDPRPGEEDHSLVFAFRVALANGEHRWRVYTVWDGQPSMLYSLDTLRRIHLDVASVVPLVPAQEAVVIAETVS